MTALARQRRHTCYAAALALMVLGIALVCTLTSRRWIGRTFPGFFVMANKVVASVSLPDWPVAGSGIYQRAVIAVNGTPVADANEIYAAVQRLPVDSGITYALEEGNTRSTVVMRSRRFTYEDYFLIFPPYLLSGIALALIGIVVWWLAPEAPASKALLIGGLAGGVFAITAADLYSPGHFFRLHIMGEAFFPASLEIHLALVFPADRLRRWRKLLLAVPYAIAFALSVPYEIYLYKPAIYSLIHNLCMIYAGVGGAILLGAVTWDYFSSESYAVRQRIRIILLGLIAGFGFPGCLMFYSGIAGGGIPVNYAGYTVFLFPLSVGYAILKHDLFEIDRFLKRSVYYLALTTTLIVGYVGLLNILDLELHASTFGHSLAFSLLFLSGAALMLNPLKNLLQGSIDRIFFRLHYDPRAVLEASGAALTSTLRLNETMSIIWNTVAATLAVRQCAIFHFKGYPRRYAWAYPPRGDGVVFAPDHPLVQKLKCSRKKVFTLEDRGDSELGTELEAGARGALAEQGAALAVPLELNGDLLGFILLGRKESGAFFSADDINFLSALGNQSALSIANAIAYEEIAALNEDLEERVNKRTRELARSNEDLRLALDRLGRAYRDLQQSREDLTRSEKMAALGRLAAGIAHEMNTPLGASMTSLKLIQDLLEEQRNAMREAGVERAETLSIDKDLAQLVINTRQWIEKAAAHIRSLKAHTRDLKQEERRSFPVRETLDQIRPLLAHRLRLADCTLTVSIGSPEPILFGEPGRLSQVLTNLIVNAIDAYADCANERPDVAVDVGIEETSVLITISDSGAGIPPENLSRIFDEFFSTKPLGTGTGLGLPIARDIVSNLFGGTLTVQSTVGKGTKFIVQIPRRSGPEAEETASPMRVSGEDSSAADAGKQHTDRATHLPGASEELRIRRPTSALHAGFSGPTGSENR